MYKKSEPKIIVVVVFFFIGDFLLLSLLLSTSVKTRIIVYSKLEPEMVALTRFNFI